MKLTVAENRTGFYLRVLQTGVVQAGDPWLLQSRPNRTGSLPVINRCMYLDFDPGYARTMLEMEGLAMECKYLAREKMQQGDKHWTASIRG